MRRRPSVLARLTRRFVTCIATLPAWLGAASGCSFDPGHDYAITSTWLLNGVTPDATRCKELGIDQFRLRIEGAGPPVTLDSDCESTVDIGQATFGGFQTTRSFDFGVVYSYSVEALDAKGKVTYVSPPPGEELPTVTAEYGKTALVNGEAVVNLNTVDVFEPAGEIASLSAEWAFSDGDLAADCEENKVEKVELWIASVTDGDFFDFAVIDTVPCEAGSITSKGKVLARGDYYFMYVALDSRGAIAERSEPINVPVDEPGDLALPRHQFKGL